MSEQYPPVSIYITTFLGSAERGEVLKATVQNALALNYPAFEVVVGDNAGAYPAAKALADIEDPRLRIERNEENLGQAGNSNMCLEYCKHDIIKVHCDDDLLHPDTLLATVPHVDDDTYVVVDKRFFVIGTTPEELFDPIPEQLEIETRVPGYREDDFWGNEHVVLPGCCLFTRNLFVELGGFDPATILFDFDFMLEARLRKTVVFVKYPLCWMGEWADSLSSQMLRDRPFFFAKGQLYGKYRILQSSWLDDAGRAALRRFMRKQHVRESLRLPRHLFDGKYWKGWFDYAAEHKRLARATAADFPARDGR